MNAVDLIRRKRDGEALSAEAIDWLVQSYTRGEVADYQMSAFLMAVLWRGMSRAETVALTLSMLHSGVELLVREHLTPVADKHSTGGVGDKVTLAVAPLVAACGLPVAKMTGRGLGHTGPPSISWNRSATSGQRSPARSSGPFCARISLSWPGNPVIWPLPMAKSTRCAMSPAPSRAFP